jgi:ribonuclease P/MRP protein subunit POP5
MRPIRPIPEDGEIMIGERAYAVCRYPGQKVDLIEKGIKHQKRFFFSELDLEER